MPGVTRVLIVSPYLPPHVGGVERTTAWMSEVLSARGISVRTLGHDIAPGTGDYHWPALAAPIGVPLPGVSLRAARELSAATRWAQVVLIQNVFYPLSTLAAFAARRERRPALTLVHANAALPSPDAPAWARAAEVAHARSLGAAQLRGAPPIAISHSSAQFIATHYRRTAPVLPLPLPDALPPVRGPHAARDPLRVVLAGRLSAVKAPLDALAACRAAARRQAMVVDIYGDGPLAERVRAAAPAWVHLHGARPWAQVMEAVRAADVFLTSSVIDNAQTSLLEALAMGVPAAATDVGEAGRYLDGPLRTGLARAGDPVRLGQALGDLADDYARIEAATRARAAQLRATHDSERCAQLLIAYLRRAGEGSLHCVRTGSH